jgi:hypothetical protein
MEPAKSCDCSVLLRRLLVEFMDRWNPPSCTYKSWHRPNRRYPGVYLDMFHDRIKNAETTWAAHRSSIEAFSNPQPNPQKMMSCTTCRYFGSPRVVVSRCKTYPGYAHTVEVVGSNPTAPTISFLGLAGTSTPRARPTTQPTIRFSLDHLRGHPQLLQSVVSSISGTLPPIAPNIPPEVGSSFATLNVDGGVTNNDPFNYAQDHLFALDPLCTGGKNLQDPLRADRGVISIAPCPTTDKFDTGFDPAKESGIFSVLSRLVAALISQTRFFGESLNQITTGTTVHDPGR